MAELDMDMDAGDDGGDDGPDDIGGGDDPQQTMTYKTRICFDSDNYRL